ncbi:integrase core domain-containing protein [Methylobacterium sp. CM6241]
MEVLLQRRSTPHGPGRLDAPSLRQSSCHCPRTCIGRGPQTGSTPDWRCHYNDDRPHTALGGLTPRAFANQVVTARELA